MRKRLTREIKEWIVLILILGTLYATGTHVVVLGKVQEIILHTGLIKPKQLEETSTFSYNFKLSRPDDSIIPGTELAGKVVLVNFWATWCPPCIAELPDLHKLYHDQKDDIEFIFVSLDQDKTKAVDFLTKRNFDLPLYFPASGFPKEIDISSIPTTYVIDQSGKIVIEQHGMAKYTSDSFVHLLNDLSKTE